jgi:hypothetical protein
MNKIRFETALLSFCILVEVIAGISSVFSRLTAKNNESHAIYIILI